LSTTLYSDHLARLTRLYDTVLERENQSGRHVDALLVHSGSEQTYFGDDRHIGFQAFGHFNHWIPVNRPDQFVLYQTGCKPTYLQVVPDVLWYEQTIAVADWWAERFDVVRLNQLAKLATHLQGKSCVYLGGNTALAKEWGIAAANCNPDSVMAYLDFQRAIKSHY